MEGWDVTTIIDAAVALGTGALAIATFVLVRRTRQEAEATREAVEATKASGRENVRARIDARAPRVVILPRTTSLATVCSVLLGSGGQS